MISAIVRRMVIGPIRAYQLLLSPFFGRQCRFYPTCSQYAIEAIASHGVLRGCGLSAWRLLKCHPFHPGGIDPIPSRRNTPAGAPAGVER